MRCRESKVFDLFCSACFPDEWAARVLCTCCYRVKQGVGFDEEEVSMHTDRFFGN